MAIKPFVGDLNTNEFYNSIYNMLRLAQISSDNLKGLDDTLANRYRVDGGMYNDKSIFTDMDVLYSRVWDPNDTNVLAPEATVKPVQEEIVVNQFRQIGLYTDEYLSKRAWMDATTYDQFRSVVQKQVSETKRVFEQKLIDTYVGTAQPPFYPGQKNVQDVTLPVVEGNQEATNRLQAQEIAKTIGDVFTALKDPSRDFNYHKFLKAFKEEDFDIVWNADFYNKILYTDLPTIFHKDNLLKNGKVLPAYYFGSAPAGSVTTADGTTIRSLKEYIIAVDSNNNYVAEVTAATKLAHVFPGDLLPKNTPITSGRTGDKFESYTNASFREEGYTQTVSCCVKACAYAVNNAIICKIIHKDAIKYLSSFETGTEFWNPKNLTSNRYLTWAYADPTFMFSYPIIRLQKKA